MTFPLGPMTHMETSTFLEVVFPDPGKYKVFDGHKMKHCQVCEMSVPNKPTMQILILAYSASQETVLSLSVVQFAVNDIFKYRFI